MTELPENYLVKFVLNQKPIWENSGNDPFSIKTSAFADGYYWYNIPNKPATLPFP